METVMASLMTRGVFLVFIGLALSVHTVSAQAPATPVADPVFNAAKAEFERMDEPARKALQDDLVWTGDYNGITQGVYGKMTFRATQAFQKRSKLPEDGILTGKGRLALATAARGIREQAQFAVAVDPRTKARIGIPRAVLTKNSDNPSGGTRWQSADEKITVDSIGYGPGDTDIDSLFERATNVKTPDRKVTYKFRNEAFFVVTGETATGKSFTRFESGPEGIRGIRIGYDKSVSAQFDRMVIAIVNSFEPFPGTTTPTVAQAPALPVVKPAVQPTAAPSPLPFATGLIVAKGRVLTALPANACANPVIDGKAAKIERHQDGLMLLAVENTAEPLILRQGAAANEVFAVTAAVGGRRIVGSGQAVSPETVIVPLMKSASGAPLFSRDGALIGLIAPMTDRRDIDGLLPTAPRQIIPTATVQKFLGGTASFVDSGNAPTDAASQARHIVGIECR